MKKIRTLMMTLAMVLGVATVSLVPAATYAACPGGSPAEQIQCGSNEVGGNNAGNQRNLTDIVKTVINVLLFVIGAVAVIMIIIGAFRYVISGGDSSSVAAAKNTILYAVIGLVIAILAFAIVNFVVTSIK